MAYQNKDFMPRWYEEVWNNQNEAAIDEMMHPHAQAHGLAEGKIVGTENFKTFYRAFNETFKDISVTVDKNLADGDFLTSIVSVQATSRKTGKTVHFTGSATAQLENGVMINAWNNFDFLSMHVQLGNINPADLI